MDFQGHGEGDASGNVQGIGYRQLPDDSKRGRHRKTFSLLADLNIAAELCCWLRSNKWCMDPNKLLEYSRVTMVTTEHKKYMDHVNKVEMPNGLKKYLELELFPQIQYKAGSHGIAIHTAQCWLHANGFEFKSHAQGLYYDGHE
ncbi:hypothetical protein K439DRAFT_1625422 [Ramaria rubella]|nr:hypothetical protein K439DRAFT_1625422 [Ramaria rubella]